jgi:uncharacterized protein (TIGR00304 family)
MIVFGILAIAIGILTHFTSSFNNDDESPKVESKGVILIGPIPIVWGYGARGWLIAGIVAVALYLILTLAMT